MTNPISTTRALPKTIISGIITASLLFASSAQAQKVIKLDDEYHGVYLPKDAKTSKVIHFFRLPKGIAFMTGKSWKYKIQYRSEQISQSAVNAFTTEFCGVINRQSHSPKHTKAKGLLARPDSVNAHLVANEPSKPCPYPEVTQ